MAKRDGLLFGLGRAKIPGSAKTVYNHRVEAANFVQTLRILGYGVDKWSNITNKHVGAVVEMWKADGLSIATIKEYLSGVRATCISWGNSHIHKSNDVFGLGQREYVTNKDKSASLTLYAKVLTELRGAADVDKSRVAMQLELEREFGLRKEEAFKLQPQHNHLQDGRLYITFGTKGGRDRVIVPNDRQKEVLGRAKALCMQLGSRNLMPPGKTEKQWEGKYYKILNEHGLTKKAGGSSHGLRHAYIQERYQQMTGFAPPCKCKTRSEFRENAKAVAGEQWRELDREARLILKGEAGHGPDRDDVMSIYLGSCGR